MLKIETALSERPRSAGPFGAYPASDQHPPSRKMPNFPRAPQFGKCLFTTAASVKQRGQITRIKVVVVRQERNFPRIVFAPRR